MQCPNCQKEANHKSTPKETKEGWKMVSTCYYCGHRWERNLTAAEREEYS